MQRPKLNVKYFDLGANVADKWVNPWADKELVDEVEADDNMPPPFELANEPNPPNQNQLNQNQLGQNQLGGLNEFYARGLGDPPGKPAQQANAENAMEVMKAIIQRQLEAAQEAAWEAAKAKGQPPPRKMGNGQEHQQPPADDNTPHYPSITITRKEYTAAMKGAGMDAVGALCTMFVDKGMLPEDFALMMGDMTAAAAIGGKPLDAMRKWVYVDAKARRKKRNKAQKQIEDAINDVPF